MYNIYQRIRHLLRVIFRPGTVEREMQAEMHQHIERATARYIAGGLSPSEARYAARREFGVLGPLQEESRDARGARWIDTARRDLSQAVRGLRSSPVFASVAILSLAIGIGANTAIFSLIDAVLLKSLPIARPEQLAIVKMHDPEEPTRPGSMIFTNPQWEQLRDRTGDIATYAASGEDEFNLATGGVARNAKALWVNGDFFTTLGVQRAAGRLLTRADDYRGCPGIVVVSYGFWQSELAGDDAAIGRTITLNSRPFTLVGVTAPNFFGVDVGQTTQLYVPLCADPLIRGSSSRLDRRSTWFLRILARPKAPVILSGAKDLGPPSIALLSAQLHQAGPPIFENTTPPNWSARDQADYHHRFLAAEPAGNGISFVRKEYSKALWVLMAMVGIVLLIACANVANLLLARGAARSREMAIRVAIGASRLRLIVQQMTESLVIAVSGTLLGLLIALLVSRSLVALLDNGSDTTVFLDLALDLRVLGFSAVACVGTALLFGLVPAWRATMVDPQSAMKSGGRGQSDGHSRFRIGKALVVVQCALALVLVVGAGLLLTTFNRLATTDAGFTADGVLIAGVDFERLPRAEYLSTERQLLERFRVLPGVRAAAKTDVTPVSGTSWNDEIAVDGFTPKSRLDDLVWMNQVSDDYFRTLGTPMLAGRDFGAQDTPRTPVVAIVNKAVVDKFFHGASPIGKSYRVIDHERLGPPVTIVGVVGVAKYNTLREKAEPIVYTTTLQDSISRGSGTFLLSVRGSPSSVIASVTRVSASMDTRISLRFRSLSDQIAAALQRERLLAVLSGFFGALALTLAMIGLYGVMAYTVARRRVEIGIRIALGAVRSRVIRLIFGDVAWLISIGIVIGAAGAWAGTRLLESLLFGVKATDPTTLIVAALVLGVAALVAGAIPAGRAARLEPVEALRED